MRKPLLRFLAQWRVAGAALPALLLGACASGGGASEFAPLRLFGSANTPRFTLYVACAGQAPAETQLCRVPFKYFAEWAGEHHVAEHQLAEFDAAHGLAADGAGTLLDYRVVVSFRPVALPSYSSEVDGMGGYVAPKAGYGAAVFVYAAAGGKLLAHSQFHHKADAKYQGDAVPFVKDGVRAVTASLEPARL